MWPINLNHGPIYSNILQFSKANSGCILQFSKTKYPIFLLFSKNLYWEATLLYGKKCFNRAESIKKITHSARLRTYWFILFPYFPQILYGVFATSNQIIVFPKRVFTNYSTHWFGVKYIISSQIDTLSSFARKIVSLFVCV